MQRRTIRAVVTGRVQGVGFRAWTQNQARMRGLQGWVRNRRDGSVEALFAGSDEAVAAMLEALRVGPTGGRVEAVAVTETDGDGSEPAPERFDILPTA